MSSNFSFYSSVVVPLFSTFIGGSFGVLAGLLVAYKSEKFRRLASWEPYAKDLWSRQAEVCIEILGISNKALNAALYCFDVFNSEKSSQQKNVESLNNELFSLSELKGKRLTLCTPNYNQSVEMFCQQMYVIVEQYGRGKLNQNLTSNLPQLWFDLVDDTRAELRVERLDTQARKAVEEACTAPKYNPTGNSTLPY